MAPTKFNSIKSTEICLRKSTLPKLITTFTTPSRRSDIMSRNTLPKLTFTMSSHRSGTVSRKTATVIMTLSSRSNKRGTEAASSSNAKHSYLLQSPSDTSSSAILYQVHNSMDPLLWICLLVFVGYWWGFFAVILLIVAVWMLLWGVGLCSFERS
jgi:hypothetical protein